MLEITKTVVWGCHAVYSDSTDLQKKTPHNFWTELIKKTLIQCPFVSVQGQGKQFCETRFITTQLHRIITASLIRVPL